MICPNCNYNFDREDGSCPRCGAVRGVVKTSTILISVGETRGVYRSVDEIPDSLRSRFLSSTSGLNSETIVIADRQGRKEIAKAIRNLPVTPKHEPETLTPSKTSHMAFRVIALLILAAAIAVVWTLFR